MNFNRRNCVIARMILGGNTLVYGVEYKFSRIFFLLSSLSRTEKQFELWFANQGVNDFKFWNGSFKFLIN